LKGLAEAQVSINLDLSEPKVKFGVLGETASNNWWAKFVARFGRISWSVGGGQEGGKELKMQLTASPVDIILLEAGRLSPKSPVWNSEHTMVVVSLEGWRGCPPKEWTIRRRKIRHDEIGGVTNGEFGIHIAHRGDFDGFDWFGDLKGVPAKLNHVLTYTGSGRKVPATDATKRGWTDNDKLIWGGRFEKIDTPRVYFKDAWLSRRLELKELKTVLDVPDGKECGTALRQRLRLM
jgi:hypothetical protein